MDLPDDPEAWPPPPTTPAEALAEDSTLSEAFAAFDLLPLLLVLAGLQTDPSFQANSVRLEWASRLALLRARGAMAPSRTRLARLLNQQMSASRIPLLEDPIEDVMVEPVCTPRGEFPIFTATWEKAGHYTETVAGAFWMLPDGEQKVQALDQIFALLELSDLLVRRAGLKRYTVGGGTAKAALELPAAQSLSALSERAFFSWHDLADADLDVGLLAPFILHPSRFESLADREAGDSLLDFHPLILADEGIIVAAPGNLSTAVRARLLDVAISGGMGDRLSRHLLSAQANLVEQGGLVKARGPLAAFGGGFSREHVEAVSRGRYVHVLHAIESFGDFPRHAFAMARDGDPAFGEAIVNSIVAAQAHAAAQADFQHGISFVFLAGWGSGLTLDVSLPPLSNWQIVVLAPHDGFVLGGCDDTALQDLIWMDRQFQLVGAQGFDFVDINGFLNRFQLWRNTDHAFIPEDVTDCEPPIEIRFGTDLLLEARLEAHLAWDRRVLPRPGGGAATMMRMNPRTLFEERQPIYASYIAAQNGRFASAVLVDDYFPVWFALDLTGTPDAIVEDAFETFKAMLEWAARVFARELSERIDDQTAPIEIRLRVGWPETGAEIGERLSDAEVAAAIAVVLDAPSRSATITLAPAWQIGLQRPDNQAEAALASAVLRAAQNLLGLSPSAGGVARMRAIVGGADVRWRHGLEVRRVVEMLKAKATLPAFRPIPKSVEALVRTGIGWATHARSDGSAIIGKAACRAFLDSQSALLLGSLRYGVRQFRRDSLVRGAIEALQAASADDQHWERSARALRAIHGASSDYRVSLERRHAINSVIRASTMIAELALAERLVHEAQRDRAVRDYVKNVSIDADEEEQEPSPNAAAVAFDAAVRAEYGASFEGFVGLARACADLAIARGQAVLDLRRSELIAALNAGSGEDLTVLVDRLTLSWRDGWNAPMSNASSRDFDLAKLDRRFSPIGRPILALDGDPDPRLMIGPGVVERCILHNLQGATTGTLQGEFWTSRAMREYVGTRGRLEGNRFNDVVARKLRALGLIAFSSAKPSWCFNHKNTPEVAELGDFDVLALTPDGSRAWIVEAKDLKLCRTLGESARRVSEYEGRILPNGKPDKMLRHLRRVGYAREHVADLARRLKLPAVPVVAGILVVRAPQPIEALLSGVDADASVVMLSDLEGVPWHEGWPPETPV